MSKTTKEVIVIAGAGVLALVLYDFIVKPTIVKVSGPPPGTGSLPVRQ